MQKIEPLTTTASLSDEGGIWKKWPWKDDDHYGLMCDLVLKANYSIQDFNATIEDGFSDDPKDVVYLIVLATWIKDAYWQIKSRCLREDVASSYVFSKEEALEKSRAYIDAVRSAVVAHPLDTSRHGEYGFGDNGRICVDIRVKSIMDSFPGAVIRRITLDGEVEAERVEDDDIALMTCLSSPTKGKLHFERYCLDMTDVRDAAEMYVGALIELDRHLSRLRMKDFTSPSTNY